MELFKEATETTTMKTKLFKLKLALFVLMPAIIMHSCEGVGVNIDPCTIPVNLELLNRWDSIEGQSTGTIEVEATRGNGGYEYSLGEGDYQSSGSFENLPGGVYVVNVRDREGCTNSITITIEEVQAPSFANVVFPIIERRCSIRTCHIAVGTRAPFVMLDHEDVAARAASIRPVIISRVISGNGNGVTH